MTGRGGGGGAAAAAATATATSVRGTVNPQQRSSTSDRRIALSSSMSHGHRSARAAPDEDLNFMSSDMNHETAGEGGRGGGADVVNAAAAVAAAAVAAAAATVGGVGVGGHDMEQEMAMGHHGGDGDSESQQLISTFPGVLQVIIFSTYGPVGGSHDNIGRVI